MHAQIYTLLPLTRGRICFSKVSVRGLAQEAYICRWQDMNLPSVFRSVSPAVLCKVPGLCLHARAFRWRWVQSCPPCLELNHRSCVPGCTLSQSYIYVVVGLEDRCFFRPLLAFFLNTVKEKHTHLPELGVLLTAEQCDGCARASFHQNIKP